VITLAPALPQILALGLGYSIRVGSLTLTWVYYQCASAHPHRDVRQAGTYFGACA